jgi:cell division protein FtsW
VNATPQQEGPSRIDPGIAITTASLITLGIVMSYSATATLALDAVIPPLFFDHLVGVALGLLAGSLAYSLPAHSLRQLALPFWMLTLLLLGLTLLFGVEVNGAQRWLEIPATGFRFQPGELAKCATLLAIATMLSRKDDRREISNGRSIEAAGIALLPAGLLMLQPDLGNAVVLIALCAFVLLVAGTPWPRFVLPGVAGILIVAAYVASNEYARRRVMGFLDPYGDAQGAGWQLVQSYIAFSQGGLLGQGLGNSRQKLEYLPEAHTDFVLALVAEELGLLGVLFVLGAFGALWVTGTRAARHARDRFDLLCGFSMVALLTLPALLNAAVVMGLVPTKGLTLPFLSYGRTSLVVSCFALGILLGVAKRRAPRSNPKPAEAAWPHAG